MDDTSFNIASNKMKIAQIVEDNQLFQLLNLDRIYGNSFFELSRMLTRKNVNSDVSKDSSIFRVFPELFSWNSIHSAGLNR